VTPVDTAIRRQLLRALLVATMGVAALAGGFALLLAGTDLSERGESWDGFGLFLGALLGVPALVVGGLALAAFRSVRRDLTRARWLGAVTGGLLALPAVTLPGHPLGYVTLLLGLSLVGAALLARSEADTFGT
jgi:hypothetical protein